jgi:hypothetical protein
MSGIICDIDDVVGMLGVTLNNVLNEKFGVSIPFDEYHEYDYFKKYGMCKDAFFELIGSNDFFSSLPFECGAINALKKIKASGLEINMVTSRGFLRNAEEITRNWLDAGGAKIDRLIVVPTGRTKSSEYKKIGCHFDYIFDDLPENISDAIDSGIVDRFALINKPWNKYSQFDGFNVERFSSLIEFTDKKGL